MSSTSTPSSSEQRLQQASDWWSTSIIDIRPGVINTRGIPIQELIGKVSFPQMIWLMLRGDLPSEEQARLLEASLVAAVDHGPQAPSIAIARMSVTCGLPLNGAMASAINVLDDVHGGAGEQCLGLYQSILQLLPAGDHAVTDSDLERAAELDRLPTIHEGPRVTAIRRECEREQRAPLAPVTRLQVNNDRRQLAADRAELGSVSAQIIDIEQARAERAARQQVAGAASAGMEAFKARFQQSQDMAAKIEAERAQLAAEAQRVAQERAAEQAAQERAKAPKHAALSNDGPTNTKGRSGPDFSM